MAMPLPLQLGASERALFERAFAAIEERGTQEMRDEASVMRAQLARHAQYVRACARIEEFSDKMRSIGAPLAPLRFPIRLTDGTRASVQAGMYRSFTRFVEDLHDAVLVEHGGELDAACTDLPAFAEQLAGALTLEACRVLDGEVTHAHAVRVVVHHVEQCRLAAVRKESEALLPLGSACESIVEILRFFGRTLATCAKGLAGRMRTFLRASDRKGLRAAGKTLLETGHLRDLLAPHRDWLSGEARAADDAQMVRMCTLLQQAHSGLAEALTWQSRRVRWLAAAHSSNACWCGLSITSGVEGSLLHAPAHMRSFATGKRMRVARVEQGAPFTCRLGAACVANTLVDLMRDGHMVLNRVSAGYATRILTFDFCKYEKVARNTLDDHVRPWAARVCGSLVERRGARVPFRGGRDNTRAR
jgi:hypothetical protein